MGIQAEILALVESLNSILWGPIMLVLLLGTGIYFTIRTKFIQIRFFKQAWRQVLGNAYKDSDSKQEGLSSFQSLTTAVAAQVGTGNIVGVATAIAAGGPGAVFWMWISGFFGMSTIFSEAVLAQKFKTTRDGAVVGGPAYYISQGLGQKWLAVIFAICIIFALGFMGNMVQANSIAISINNAFGINQTLVGIIVALMVGAVILGGVKQIGKVTEVLVPFMALFYIAGGLVVIIFNIENLLPALKMIVIGAFSPQSIGGGVLGATIREAFRYGIARGIFSNEAGLGSTPHAHAIARVNHPAEQGFVAMVGVFIVTGVICTMTALVILTAEADYTQATGAILSQMAFANAFGAWFGPKFLAVALFFFAYSTLLGWYYFAETNVRFLFGAKPINIFKIIVLCIIAFGSTLEVKLVWALADFFNGLMIIPNLIGVLGLSAIAISIFKEYEEEVFPTMIRKAE